MASEAHDTSGEVDGTQADKINTGALGTLVAVGLCAVLSIAWAVTALVRHDIEVEESTKDADANAVVIALKNSQRGMLSGPASYLDRGKGVVSLPIALAKGLVLSDLQRDPNSATPAPPPQAAGTVTETADAGPAPNASVTSTAAIKKPEPAKNGETVKEKNTEPKPAPATSAKPVPVTAASASPPNPTPTAATPGAEAPGPMQH